MPSIASATVANYTSALQERLHTTLASVAATVTATSRLELSNFLPTTSAHDISNAKTETTAARLSYVVNQDDVGDVTTTTTIPTPTTATTATSLNAAAAAIATTTGATSLPTFSAPHVASLVASSAEDLNGGFRDGTFDIFDDEHDLYGSPLAFDASEHGLWNGRFVPPPPRPPFFVDEPVLSDGLTTCDLCSWAMPTKSTFIFEGTIEKATELGWPLTLIIVSVLSALFGAIIMIAVVRCRRKKSSNHRNDNHVQWWSRNKRPNAASAAGTVGGQHNNANNNNHLRRSNIYTAHPADSIRGLQPLPQQQPPPTLSASSSLTAMTAAAMMANVPSVPTIQQQHYHPYHPQQQQHLHHHHQQQQQQQQHFGPQPNAHLHHQHQQQQQQLHHQQQQLPHEYVDDYEEEHEYHQPQELQLQLQMPLQQQHQRQHSSSMSSVITSPSPSLLHANMLPQTHPQHTLLGSGSTGHSQQRSSLELQQDAAAAVATVAATRHWPQASTMVVAS